MGLAYNLSLTIKKKGLFTTNEEFVQAIQYTHIVHPERPLPLREEAYAEGSPLLGPDVDSDGWELGTSNVKGRLFGTSDIEIYARLSLATPLVYPLGGFIPFILTFEGTSTEGLDLFTSSSAFSVTLMKRAVIGDHATTKESAGKKKMNEFMDTVAKATCWIEQPTCETKGPRVTTHHGEIRVPSTGLISPFVFPGVSISYVVILKLDAAGFAPVSVPPHDAFIIIPVSLASYAPDGPVARSYAPAPTYRTSVDK